MNKYLESVSSRYGKKVNHLWGDLVTNKCSLLENNCIECLVVRYNLETKEKIEISNKSHPFFTGKQNLVDTAGRIEKFNQKYGKK